MQTALNAVLDSGRTEKAASGVYLMEHISHPGILVECGFLSNPAEEQHLSTPEYQRALAAVMAAVLARFADNRI